MPNYSMTRLYYILTTFFIYSCSAPTDDGQKISTSQTIDTLIPFSGHWTTEKYLQTLQRTKSPKASQDDGSFLFIPSSLSGLAYPYVYHEGGAQFRIKKYGDRFFLKLTEEYDQSDSTEIIVNSDGNRLQVWDRNYIKLNDMNTIAEKVIFEGRYIYGDKTITISEFGAISGLDSVSSLTVENDYIGPGMDMDLIYLRIGDQANSSHTFEFYSDTLRIYDVYCNESDENDSCLDTRRGKLKWTLVRITGHNSR
jgi:hypothetical protein